jgi:hypothetical protein
MMRSSKVSQAAVAACAILATLLLWAASASATGGVSLCIPETEGGTVVTAIKGVCKSGYKLQELGAEGKEGKAGKEGAPEVVPSLVEL